MENKWTSFKLLGILGMCYTLLLHTTETSRIECYCYLTIKVTFAAHRHCRAEIVGMFGPKKKAEVRC